MGKGELWDDSALINAFDDAMSKYKKMHGKKASDNSTYGEEVSSSVAHQSHSVRDAEENTNVTSNTSTNFEETKNLTPLVQDDQCLESVDPVFRIDSSNDQQEQAVNDYSYSNVEGYNQLLTQYYELEEKRQKILHQLKQFGGYDYQYSAEGFGPSQQLGACCNFQDHSVCTTLAGLCCPYACHCFSVSSTLCPSCSCKVCANSSALDSHAKSGPFVDSDIVKTAMGAAEKAISSMKEMSFTKPTTEDKEKGKDIVEENAQSMTPETDLSVVLNAWYSAGFYTGKDLGNACFQCQMRGGPEECVICPQVQLMICPTCFIINSFRDHRWKVNCSAVCQEVNRA